LPKYRGDGCGYIENIPNQWEIIIKQ
jgi:hypothetical protein